MYCNGVSCSSTATCADKTGNTLNSASCQCGTQLCTSTNGLYCNEASETCSLTTSCSITDGSQANSGECKCVGSNICTTATGLFCDAGACSRIGSIAKLFETPTQSVCTAANPISCQAYHDDKSATTDGGYLLDVPLSSGQIAIDVTVYCHNMNTATPTQWLVLPNSGTTNYNKVAKTTDCGSGPLLPESCKTEYQAIQISTNNGQLRLHSLTDRTFADDPEMCTFDPAGDTTMFKPKAEFLQPARRVDETWFYFGGTGGCSETCRAKTWQYVYKDEACINQPTSCLRNLVTTNTNLLCSNSFYCTYSGSGSAPWRAAMATCCPETCNPSCSGATAEDPSDTSYWYDADMKTNDQCSKAQIDLIGTGYAVLKSTTWIAKGEYSYGFLDRTEPSASGLAHQKIVLYGGTDNSLALAEVTIFGIEVTKLNSPDFQPSCYVEIDEPRMFFNEDTSFVWSSSSDVTRSQAAQLCTYKIDDCTNQIGTVNNDATQTQCTCDSQLCTIDTGMYCNGVSCSSTATCADKTGNTLNSASCQCGTQLCTSTNGLYLKAR